ncbi:hypothetical protein caldi_27720 [Caldinitratiruptor microaerophilus]|uniref:Uncharacterized protein n=1 Tax=Caldinitratiruptor microaerophilus TaxID=671077 RepID=A0AA35CM14_9FIRM|nr:hypothetical protein caldi_27720 [Caldinitratiruptor microaerophilus]
MREGRAARLRREFDFWLEVLEDHAEFIRSHLDPAEERAEAAPAVTGTVTALARPGSRGGGEVRRPPTAARFAGGGACGAFAGRAGSAWRCPVRPGGTTCTFCTGDSVQKPHLETPTALENPTPGGAPHRPCSSCTLARGPGAGKARLPDLTQA